MELTTDWHWEESDWRSRISDVQGILDAIRLQIRGTGPPSLGHDSAQWKTGKKVSEILLGKLERPPPVDVGGTSLIEGVNASVTGMTSSGGKVVIVYRVRYSDTLFHRSEYQWGLDELTPMLRAMVETLDRDAERMAREFFTEHFAAGESDPTKWPREKTEVFISYRSNSQPAAKQLFEGLGDLEEQTLFLPRLDHVDMQAGNWLDQLMQMISQSEAFVPVLSDDYLNGPISRPELDLAMREHFRNSSKRIVPVLIEGDPESYTNHFIGGFHMVKAQGGITEETITDVAALLLGVSRNPYE